MTRRPNAAERSRIIDCDPLVLGTVLAFLSALGYTAANVCLRALTHCDPIWVSCVKAFPTIALVSPWLVRRVLRNQVLVPSLRALGLLVLAGIFGQLAGNVLFQWSLSVVGIALTVPLTLGAMIAGGTLMGRWLLNEQVTGRMMVAIAILIGAIFVLGLGAPAANQALSQSVGHELRSGTIIYLVAGVMAACTAGIAYSALGGALRHAAATGMPLVMILGTVSIVGVLGLGGLSLLNVGPAAMVTTQPADMATMLLAGVLNAGAFWSLTKALHLTGLVYVNALNASQTALAAVAGLIFFREAPTAAMAAGVLLTIVGLLLMTNSQRRKPAGEDIDVAPVPPVLPDKLAVVATGEVGADS